MSQFRDDFKKQRALDEQRKAGNLPAQVDAETGKDINPHIPNYIAKAPWYLDVGHPTLKHQRNDDQKERKDQWYQRGARIVTNTKKFRKGACENCGAMTHKTKECMERPRKVGAKYTNQDIQPDEVVQDIELGFEAKRDRWNGFNPAEQLKIAEEWELIDEERKKLREAKALERLNASADEPVIESEDEDKYAESADMPSQKADPKTRTTVRNLRIREDTAKYLLNLDVNSAYYDPKTRSMRENPLQDKDSSDLTYAGDNFVRFTGDAPKMIELQMFAWEASHRGNDVHMQANPSQAELLYRQYKEKKEGMSSVLRQQIFEKYGGQEHLEAPPKELLLAQNETYVEYSQTGKLILGPERAKIKSRYEEDVYLMNHTSVWGSYWVNGQWGYACCHSLIKSSYCAGEAGREAAAEAVRLAEEQANMAKERAEQKSLVQEHQGKILTSGKLPGKKRIGEGDVELDPKKLKKALEEEKKRLDAGMAPKDKDVTEEELEAYRLLRKRHDDPMANYQGD